MLFAGFLWGILFYFIAFMLSLWLYRSYSPMYKNIIFIIFISGVGHFFGTYLYSFLPSDSIDQFFPGANPFFSGVGTDFIENIVWYVRDWLTGDSLLGTFYFFSAFAFLGSVLWYLLFLRCSQFLNIENQKRIFPALVIICWPSFFLFTAGMGKDSLSFFLIPLTLLLWDRFFYQRKNRLVTLTVLALSVVFMAMIRPYLLIIFVGAYYFSTFKGLRELSFFRVVGIVILIPVVLYVMRWVVITQGGLQDLQLMNIAQHAVLQQSRLDTGTSFSILSSNPYILLLMLPYSFFMNLVMPLFFFSNNVSGILASIENVFLVWLLYDFWRQRRLFKIIKSRFSLIRIAFYFFLIGMMFLGLINTNLGLAMRQKSMYVPAFLVVAMLTWLYKKQRGIR
ncbi:MAG: hypothetical protein A2X77_04705 [Gammaproteobacteria bacterium GWE2_42_36]|nr:MAG: hypothetical protein A2X77_04705 [Gammaproteobacteria bacterium GWE2_42_36]